MRLIDADELRRKMYHEAFETDTDMQRWDGGWWVRYKMFKNVIENAPTIEAEPKRGHWTKVYIEDEDPYFRRRFVCSACGDWQTYGETPYCPTCGAKMMDEVNE